MARKKSVGFNVEILHGTGWLWIIMPAFKDEQQAQAWIESKQARDSKPELYRIVRSQ